MVGNLYTYVQSLVGQPWERHGLHCWSLVERVQWEVFGREVPLGPAGVPVRQKRRELFSADAKQFGWKEVPAPEHGAVVRMYRVGGNPADLEHAGVYLAIDGGLILHTDAPHGVVLDSLVALKVRGWCPRWFVPAEKERETDG